MGIFRRKTEIGPDTIIQRNTDILFNEVDGEVVMLSFENGEYYGINEIGSQIWELLKNRISLRELVQILINMYNVEEEKCMNETSSFITVLLEKKLVTVESCII